MVLSYFYIDEINKYTIMNKYIRRNWDEASQKR